MVIIAHNLSALGAQRHLEKNNRDQRVSLARLSSGFRINTGADAPADLVISEQLRAQSLGLDRAIRNTQEASNVLGIAEGALNEMNAILKRMRQLALHAANNGITSSGQVAADQAELDEGIQTLGRIADTTRYSDQFLLNGNKAIIHDVQSTGRDGPVNHLVDEERTRIDSIARRENMNVNIDFNAVAPSGEYDFSKQTTKGYLELSSTGEGDVSADGHLTQDVSFTLTGRKGSRSFSFTTGTHVGQIAQTIDNVSDSLGVDASLAFDGERNVRFSGLGPTPGGDLINGLGGAAGFGEDTFGANDDGSTFLDVSSVFASGLNFFGTTYTGFWINNNGNITFGSAQSTFTPTAITGVTGNPIIAPFFADVDTRGGAAGATPGGTSTGANVVHYDLDTTNNVATITWNDVGYFGAKTDKLNAFQIRIYDRLNGDFDVELRYEDINWTTGDASGGTSGLGGTVARLGWSSGDGTNFQEYAESGNQAAVLALDGTGKSFAVRNGGVTQVTEPIDDLPAVRSVVTEDRIFNNVTDGLTGLSGEIAELRVGTDTDGEGRVWVRVLSDTTYELYRSTSFEEQFLVGHGTFGQATVADNDSNLAGLVIAAGANVTNLENGFLALDGLYGTDYGAVYTGTLQNDFLSGETVLSGLHLGEHTDMSGTLYVSVDLDGATTGTVRAYSDSQRTAESLVAQTAGSVSLAGSEIIHLDPTNDDKDGVAISLQVDGGGFSGTAGDSYTGSIGFANLGVRISADDYGTDSYVRLEQHQGQIWQQYLGAGGTSAALVGEGETALQSGSNATVSVNGFRTESNGLELNLTTPDITGQIVLLEGEVGEAGAAQVGYHTGSIYTGIGAFASDDTERAGLTNAVKNTTDKLTHFVGGMQMQLGEGAGDQERIVYGIEAMNATNLGRTEILGESFSMLSLRGGGNASLANDPLKALQIIDQAIADVSGLRARLGAFQANMLQTNANNLQVMFEKIVSTESAIRDADMAAEVTDFTRSQILSQTTTRMVAQSAAQARLVLQLLDS